MSLIQKPNKSHFWFPPAAANSNVFFFLSLVSTLLLLLPYATAQAPPSPNPNNPYGFNANFNPSMAIIIIVLISAFFFMGFFSIYLRQCAGDRSNPSVRPTNGPLGRSRRAQKGLDPTIIETFPTFIYSVVKGLKIGKATLECAVCLNEFEDDETLRLLPKCDHVFHPECIDAWLVSHVTCPVCRANLVPDSTSAETSSSAPAPDSESEFDNENETSDATNPPNQVSITVTDQPDVINPTEIPFQNRPARSRSTRRGISGKFPRSHSTGHSVIQPGENCERFTLRLPDDIRKKIVNGKLNRTASCLTFPTGYDAGGSSRRGYRGGSVNEGSSRGKYNRFWRLDSKAKSDRWVFSMAPPFVSRTGSVRRDDGDGEGSSRGSRFLTSVKSFKIKNSMDCLSGKVDGNEASTSSSSRPPV